MSKIQEILQWLDIYPTYAYQIGITKTMRDEAAEELSALRARAEQAEAERDYTGELNKVVVAQNDTLKAVLKHLQTYFEENHIERIKYPEYLEFHEYQMIAALAAEAKP